MKHKFLLALCALTIAGSVHPRSIKGPDNRPEFAKDYKFRSMVHKRMDFDVMMPHFNNSDDIPVTLTKTQKTEWNAVVDKQKDLISEATVIAKKIETEGAGLRETGMNLWTEKREALKKFGGEEWKSLKSERKKMWNAPSIWRESHKERKKLGSTTTPEQLKEIKEKLLELQKKSSARRAKGDEIDFKLSQIKLNFKKSDEFKSVFHKQVDNMLEMRKILEKYAPQQKEFRKRQREHSEQLYEIYKQVKESKPEEVEAIEVKKLSREEKKSMTNPGLIKRKPRRHRRKRR